MPRLDGQPLPPLSDLVCVGVALGTGASPPLDTLRADPRPVDNCTTSVSAHGAPCLAAKYLMASAMNHHRCQHPGQLGQQ